METSSGSMEDTIHVLLIEDDEKLARLTSQYLELRGLDVTAVRDGATGLLALDRDSYDIVLLDLLLPGKNGLDVCREIRSRSQVPIVMLTALGDEGDRVVGLEAGADDYLCKPFSTPELLARIRAHVRRARGLLGPCDHVLRVGGVCLRPGSLEASIDARRLDLTAYEFAILRVLVERAGRAVTRYQLLDLVRGADSSEVFDRSIDGHVSRLRKKLGDDPRYPRLLRTIRGVGYMFVAGHEH